MAEFNLQIGIDAGGAVRGANQVQSALNKVGSGAQTAEKGLRRTERRAKTLGQQLQTLRRVAVGAFAVFAGFRVGREFVQLSDQFTQFNNRLRLVTSSEEELATVQAELIRQSKASFVGLQAQAQVFQRVSKGAGEFGFSQLEALQATDALAKAVRLSGVDAASASAALVQLGQGIAAGALRGQELNSVLEQTPRVAQAIADALGVPIGQLRKLGEEGAISVEKLIPGLIAQIDKLDEETAKITPTVSEAFQNFQTELQITAGDLNAATGVTGILSGALQTLQDLLPTIANGMLILGENIRQVFELGRVAFTGLSEGFGILAESVLGSAEAAGTFGDAFGDLASNFIPNTITLIKIAGTEILTFFVTTETKIKQLVNSAQSIFKNFQLADAQRAGDSKLVEQLRGELIQLEKNQASYNEELAREQEFRLANIAAALKENDANRDKIKVAQQALEQARKEREEAAKRLQELEGTRAGGLAQDAPVSQVPDADAAKSAEKLQKDIASFNEANNAAIAYQMTLDDIAKLEEAGADSVAVMNARIKAQEEFLRDTDPAWQQYQDDIERAADLTRDMRTPAEELKDELADLQSLLDQGLISDETARRAADALKEAAGQTKFLTDLATAAAEDIQGAFRDLFLEGTSSLDDFADKFGQTLQRVAANFLANQAIQFLLGRNFDQGEFGGVIGGLGNLFAGGGRQQQQAIDTTPFTTTRGEADTFEAILARGAQSLAGSVQQGVSAGAPALTQGVEAAGPGLGSALAGLFRGIGQAGGAVASGVGTLFSAFAGFFDNGGDIGRGQFGIVGERGPEIVGGPATVMGRQATAGALAAPEVNVNIANVSNPREALDAVQTNAGAKSIVNQIGRNREAVRRELGLS